MVTHSLAYSGSQRVEASNFERESYFSARLSIVRVQQYPLDSKEDALDLTFVDTDQTATLPPILRHKLIGKNIASFVGEMGVFTSRQLRGKRVVGVIERSKDEVVALFPSNEAL